MHNDDIKQVVSIDSFRGIGGGKGQGTHSFEIWLRTSLYPFPHRFSKGSGEEITCNLVTRQ